MSISDPARRVLLSPAFAIPLLALIALSVRLYFGLPYKTHPDSTYYMRYAQEMGQGRFSVKLWAGVPDRFSEPLYPLSIAAAHAAGCDIEIAAWSVSVAAGALLMAPLFLLTRRLYGDRAAWAATLLAALFSPLISYSTFLLTESPFTLLFYAVVALGWAARRGDRPLRLLAAGALAGAAYQTRVIGLSLLPGLVVWPLLHNLFISRQGARRGIVASLLIVAAFVVSAGPYWIYTRHMIGEWSILGGRAVLNKKVERPAPSMVDGAGAEEDPTPTDLSRIGAIVSSMRRNLAAFAGLFPNHPPTFFILAVLGFLAVRFRDPEGLSVELYLLCHFASFVTALSVSHADFGTRTLPRYMIPLTPLVLIWAGRAAADLPGRFMSLFSRSEQKEQQRAAGRFSGIFFGLLLGLLVFSLWPGFGMLEQFREEMKRGRAAYMNKKAMCRWLQDHTGVPEEPIIFDRMPHTALILGGYHHFPPDRIDDAFLEHARSLGPAYLILDSSSIANLQPSLLPYFSGEHIPRGLRLIHQRYYPARRRLFTIYRVLSPEEEDGPTEAAYFEADRSKSSEHFLQLGTDFLKKGFLNQAKLAWLEALRTAPRSPSVHAALGETYLIKGQPILGRLADRAALEKSRYHYLMALELDPANNLARETIRRIEEILRRQ